LPDEIKNMIAADESLISPADAFSLITPPVAARIFNIKLMKCGGINEARRIAEIAQLGGVDLFWGCNDESIVSITAGLHTAFSCANTRYIDLDGSLDLGRDEVKGGFILRDGYMYCSERPGLGVERV
ncbi:MAG TPA: enolase C-terminal domain-like protein, partial [Chryseosolibacter sp.]|nr:enolase C-terminal domain-like protein [Chryseosolibacter sp.]